MALLGRALPAARHRPGRPATPGRQPAALDDGRRAGRARGARAARARGRRSRSSTARASRTRPTCCAGPTSSPRARDARPPVGGGRRPARRRRAAGGPAPPGDPAAPRRRREQPSTAGGRRRPSRPPAARGRPPPQPARRAPPRRPRGDTVAIDASRRPETEDLRRHRRRSSPMPAAAAAPPVEPRPGRWRPGTRGPARRRTPGGTADAGARRPSPAQPPPPPQPFSGLASTASRGTTTPPRGAGPAVACSSPLGVARLRRAGRVVGSSVPPDGADAGHGDATAGSRRPPGRGRGPAVGRHRDGRRHALSPLRAVDADDTCKGHAYGGMARLLRPTPTAPGCPGRSGRPRSTASRVVSLSRVQMPDAATARRSGRSPTPTAAATSATCCARACATRAARRSSPTPSTPAPCRAPR